MNYIGEAIAFAALVACAAFLEIHNKPTEGLWIIVAAWALFGTFSKDKNKENDD